MPNIIVYTIIYILNYITSAVQIQRYKGFYTQACLQVDIKCTLS